MSELVRSILHNRLVASARLPSLAGEGLTERMRSTAFALFGLTAAAGLALVALFAQPGGSLLEPAPLPAEATSRESVGATRRVVLTAHPAPASARRARWLSGDRRASASPTTGAVAGAPAGPRNGNGDSSGGSVSSPVAVPAAPAGDHAPGGQGAAPQGGAPEPDPAPGAQVPVPAPVPSSSASPAPAPVAAPPPAAPPPAPVTASVPPPSPAPGNSSSAAAAEHAAERGVEASAASGGSAKGLDR